MKNSIKIIIFFGMITIFLLIVVFLLDYFNITNYFPFNQLTNKYDWLNIASAIIGGFIGAIGTCIGIYLTIKNEREETSKRTSYSYLTFTDNPLTIKISLDSVIAGTVDLYKSQNILIGKITKIDGANYFDIELNFKNLNSNYPTAAKIEELELYYKSEVKDNVKRYEKNLMLRGYKKEYKPLTIKNKDIVAFSSVAMIDKNEFNDLKMYFINSEFIDAVATISFINANGVITNGRYSANLIKKGNIKLGNEKSLGSNKEEITYEAENTYLIMKNIDYSEKYNKKVFGGSNG